MLLVGCCNCMMVSGWVELMVWMEISWCCCSSCCWWSCDSSSWWCAWWWVSGEIDKSLVLINIWCRPLCWEATWTEGPLRNRKSRVIYHDWMEKIFVLFLCSNFFIGIRWFFFLLKGFGKKEEKGRRKEKRKIRILNETKKQNSNHFVFSFFLSRFSFSRDCR